MKLLLLGALSLGTALAATPLRIATMSPLSGSLEAIGSQIREGAQIAVDQNRAEFERLGFDLSLVSFDDKGSADTGAAEAKRLADDPTILGLVGAMNSGVTIAVSDVLKSAPVAMISPSSTSTDVTDRGLANVNRIVARDDAQGPSGAEFLAGLGVKNVFVVSDATKYGAGLVNKATPAFKTGGVQVVGFLSTEEKTNFSEVVKLVQKAEPDAVYFGGEYPKAAAFLKQLRAAGVKAKFMGGDALDTTDFLKQAGKAAAGAYFTTVRGPITAFSNAGRRTFADAYQQKYGRQPQSRAIFAYDATNVLLNGLKDAIRSAGGKLPSRAAVVTAVRKTSFANAISGTISFNTIGDRVTTPIFVIRVDDLFLTPKVERTLVIKGNRD